MRSVDSRNYSIMTNMPPQTTGDFECAITTLYSLGKGEDGSVIDVTGEYFDLEGYSSFKYGKDSEAFRYGRLLARRMVDEFGDELDDAFVASSAYKQVPTAAAIITEHVLTELALVGLQPAGLFRVDRGRVLAADYASMTVEDRERAMKENQLEIGGATSEQITGRDVIIIDDIRITGSHEHALACQLGKVGVRRALFGYVAVMDQATAMGNPELENQINSSKIKHVGDILPFIESDDFRLNARTCKFILGSNFEDLDTFFSEMPLRSARSILGAMIADGYHKNEKFADAFMYITGIVGARQLEDGKKRIYNGKHVGASMPKDARVVSTRTARVSASAEGITRFVTNLTRSRASHSEVGLAAHNNESMSRYIQAIQKFISYMNEEAPRVKEKNDGMGYYDNTWLIPSAQDPDSHVAVSIRREIAGEPYSYRAMWLKVPRDPAEGLRYAILADIKEVLDETDLSVGLARAQAAVVNTPDQNDQLTYDFASRTDDGRYFTPFIGMVWGVFADRHWVNQFVPERTRCVYYRMDTRERI